MSLVSQFSGIQVPNTVCGLASSGSSYPHYINIYGGDLILG